MKEAKNKQTSRRWWFCPIHRYPKVPSYAHLLSLAFEALGWCLQPTLPIYGERSREVWRILGTGDTYLTEQRCWRPIPNPQSPKHSCQNPQQSSRYLPTPNYPIFHYSHPSLGPWGPILNLFCF